MKTFFTVTDHETHYTNSRSKRFDTLEAAEKEVEARLAYRADSSRRYEGCYILKAVKYVGPIKPELVRIDLV